MEDTPSTINVRECLKRLKEGDASARNELIGLATDRLHRLTRRMLRQDYGDLKRWMDTADVFHNAVARLCGALSKVIPETPLHFHRLAALQVRRELIDLSRHYYGPQGMGANHASVGAHSASSEAQPLEPVAADSDPTKWLEWKELHQHVQTLPEPEAEIVDLLLYQGLSQEEAAALLGCDVRTVQRRWQKARIHLYTALKAETSRI